MISPQDLSSLFQVNYMALHTNVSDLTHEESLILPNPAGNCLNWVVGHIIHSRGVILEMLDQKALLSPIQAVPYKRGIKPTNSDILLPFRALLERLQLSQETLSSVLNSMSGEDFTTVDPEHEIEWKRQPLGDQLAFLHFHEAYHVGQTGLLRRIIGLEGAIP